jgi:hypothetical protein
MRYPIGFFPFRSSTPLIENQKLFFSNQARSGPDFLILTGHFPVPSVGPPVKPFPIRLLQFWRREEEPLSIRRLYAG